MMNKYDSLDRTVQSYLDIFGVEERKTLSARARDNPVRLLLGLE